MRLERHVGGLGKQRQENYLRARGWQEGEGGWQCDRHLAVPMKRERALHHQLTEDLCAGLAPSGWKISGYSDRGYAKLIDPETGDGCTLPAALRRQAKREGRKVRELTYALFLAAFVDSAE